MALSPIRKPILQRCFANISQAEAIKKLKLDFEWKKLENEFESIDHGSNVGNETEKCNSLDEQQYLQDGEQGCCSNGECVFLGIFGPTLDECKRLESITGQKFHHACMVTWVEQCDPNRECLKLCRDCCVKRYEN